MPLIIVLKDRCYCYMRTYTLHIVLIAMLAVAIATISNRTSKFILTYTSKWNLLSRVDVDDNMSYSRFIIIYKILYVSSVLG